MAIPLFCNECLDIIGIEAEEVTLSRLHGDNFDSSVSVKCPGKGNHPKSERFETKRLFGLIEQVIQKYPETQTTSSWEEYVGPPNKFWLWFAIVFGTERYPSGDYGGVVVNGQWAWWSRKTGFYGDGVKELANLPHAA